jgi:hypothetical protein
MVLGFMVAVLLENQRVTFTPCHRSGGCVDGRSGKKKVLALSTIDVCCDYGQL